MRSRSLGVVGVALGSFVVVASCRERAEPQMVPMYDDAAVVVEAAPLTPPPHDIGCAIPVHPEETQRLAAVDECVGEPQTACWATCESGCTSCGAACARDPACEQHCLAERDTCKSLHCGDVHARCRKALVSRWLSNKCDARCGDLQRCLAKCEDSADSCQTKCGASAMGSCDAARCEALMNAPERRTLDPRWRPYGCDQVCSNVWRCAQTRCTRTPGCNEPTAMVPACVATVAGAGACRLARNATLCGP